MGSYISISMELRMDSAMTLVQILVFLISITQTYGFMRCHGNPNAKKLQYLSGDAMSDSKNCIGPDGKMYPYKDIERQISSSQRQGRAGKSLFSEQTETADPWTTQKNLMKAYSLSRNGMPVNGISRSTRDAEENNCVVGGAPPRLCKPTYNTTAPMCGVSLTSGQPVTIVQKFPDLLQQVIYETCDSSECEVLHGECIQTYVPYLFLVIPLGPVTLTGQDYVLVESGCTCRPKYATPGTDPNPQDIIPNFS